MENNKSSIHIDDELHFKLTEIQFKLREFGIKKSLRYICGVAIRHGIENTLEFIKSSEMENKLWISITNYRT